MVMKIAYPNSSCVSVMMDSQYDTFSIGKSINIGIKSHEPYVQFVYSDQDSVSYTLLTLNLKQFNQLVKYIPLLRRSLKRGPETAKTLSEYETLLQQQTQFLIGNNVYVTVDHLQDESELQFIEYMLVQSLSVPGQRVVCPSRRCMRLTITQLEELSSQLYLIKFAIKKVEKKRELFTPTKSVCDYLPEYMTCLLTSSQKNSHGVTEAENDDSDTDI